LAIRTFTEQLESVQTLIALIEATPERTVEMDGDRYTRHDLDVLYQREERLLPLARSESAGHQGARARGVIVCD